jgi:hypothetical protein
MGIGSGGLWIGVTFATLERFRGHEYERLTGVLAAYSVGGIAGAGLGAVGGIQGPFLLYLGLTLAAAGAVRLLGKPHQRAVFRSDRTAVRTPAFLLSCAGILLVALAPGTIEGPSHCTSPRSSANGRSRLSTSGSPFWSARARR